MYCLSRKECDTCAEKLNKSGIKAGSYHAGHNDQKRHKVQADWVSNKFHVSAPVPILSPPRSLHLLALLEPSLR